LPRKWRIKECRSADSRCASKPVCVAPGTPKEKGFPKSSARALNVPALADICAVQFGTGKCGPGQSSVDKSYTERGVLSHEVDDEAENGRSYPLRSC
jgi:hypothetical protein